jgi:hypothetical protein
VKHTKRKYDGESHYGELPIAVSIPHLIQREREREIEREREREREREGERGRDREREIEKEREREIEKERESGSYKRGHHQPVIPPRTLLHPHAHPHSRRKQEHTQWPKHTGGSEDIFRLRNRVDVVGRGPQQPLRQRRMNATRHDGQAERQKV